MVCLSAALCGMASVLFRTYPRLGIQLAREKVSWSAMLTKNQRDTWAGIKKGLYCAIQNHDPTCRVRTLRRAGAYDWLRRRVCNVPQWIRRPHSYCSSGLYIGRMCRNAQSRCGSARRDAPIHPCKGQLCRSLVAMALRARVCVRSRYWSGTVANGSLSQWTGVCS